MLFKQHAELSESGYGLDFIRSEILNPFTHSKKLLMKMISLLRPAHPEHTWAN